MGSAYTTNIANGASATPFGASGVLSTDGYSELVIEVKSDKIITVKVEQGDLSSAFVQSRTFTLAVSVPRVIRVPVLSDKCKITLTNASGAATTALRVKGWLASVASGKPTPPDAIVGSVAVSTTAEVDVIADPGDGLKTFITSLVVTNIHATDASDISVKDKPSGTVIAKGRVISGGILDLSPRDPRFPLESVASEKIVAILGANSTGPIINYVAYVAAEPFVM